MKKILITGGDGFLARSFAEKYRKTSELIVCGRQQLELDDAQAVQTFLRRNQFDVVIHTATYDAAPRHSDKDPSQVLEKNLRMFFNLARCRQDFGKMIYFGSGAEFAREHWTAGMAESYFDRHVPRDQYGYSKYLMTQYALRTDNIFNLRLFAVFGEYDDWRYRFISNICAQAVLGLPITVHQNSSVDFLYINDLVRIVSWFIDNEPTHPVYNVCRGMGYEFIQLAEMIRVLAGDEIDLVVDNQDIHKHYIGSNQQLLNELTGFQFTPIEHSLTQMFRWYQENKAELSVDELHF